MTTARFFEEDTGGDESKKYGKENFDCHDIMYIDFKAVARNYPSHPGAGEYLSDPLFKKRERTKYLHQQLVLV